MERFTHRAPDWPAVSREAGTRDCTPATEGQQSAVFDGKTRDRVSSALYSLKIDSKVSDCVRASPSEMPNEPNEKTEGSSMPRKLTWLVLFSTAVVVAAIFYAGKVWATPATGFKATTIA